MFRLKSDDQIHIHGKPLIPMRVDGQPADDKVLDARVVQRFDDGFNAVDFHAPNVMLAEFHLPASLLRNCVC